MFSKQYKMLLIFVPAEISSADSAAFFIFQYFPLFSTHLHFRDRKHTCAKLIFQSGRKKLVWNF